MDNRVSSLFESSQPISLTSYWFSGLNRASEACSKEIKVVYESLTVNSSPIILSWSCMGYLGDNDRG